MSTARALQAVPPSRTKGKGGSGGDGYDAAVERIYRDPRMGRETREIALLLAWLTVKDPNRFNAGTWRRAEAILGFKQFGRHTQSVAALLVADDLPRYEMDQTGPEWNDQTCAASMVRRDGVCGQPARDNSYSVDPATGWRTPIWYCRRHASWGGLLDAALRSPDAPEPIPNAGGLLPCYFKMKGGLSSWEANYRWAAHTADPWRTEAWAAPKLGVAADLWPTPGSEEASLPAAPKLQLVALEGELVDEQTSPSKGDQVT